MDSLKTPRARLCLGIGAAALAACGGEALLLAVVTPLAGQWLDQTAGSNATVTFVGLNPAQYLYESKLTANGLLLNPGGACAGAVDADGNLPLSGTLDNGRLRMTVTQTGQLCVDGRFTDLRRLEASLGGASATRAFINDRIDVRLTEGIWVNEANTLRLKFDNNVGGSANDSIDNNSTTLAGGCDVSPGITPVRVVGTLAGFGVDGIKNPTIAALTVEGQATVRFTQVVFEDGATLSLRTAAGQSVTLSRTKEAVATSCP